MEVPRQPAALNAREFLKEMATDRPHAYVLGSFNRYITVHAQQTRALNLVDALFETEGNLAGRRIAVIGAGFAGVTVASYALEKTNAEVHIFEAASQPLWLQDRCGERWLHPGLYDWPFPGSLEPRTYFPVMNWRAGRARSVVAQVREQWEEVRTKNANLTCHFNTRVTEVSGDHDATLRLITEPNLKHVDYHFVVVATGFGVEDGGLSQPSYWNDSDGIHRAKGSILISGFGDGALADLLRLCVPNYRQDRLIDLIRDVDEDIKTKIVLNERLLETGYEAELQKFYEGLRVENLISALRSFVPKVVQKITIAGKGHIYGTTTSAILNRFLISQVSKVTPAPFTILSARFERESRRTDGKTEVHFDDGSSRSFDHVVLRHGPKPAIDEIKGLFADPQTYKRQRVQWRKIPQANDQTRVRTENDSAIFEVPEPFRALPSYESSGNTWCLLIHTKSRPMDVPVSLALKKVGRADVSGQPLSVLNLNGIKDEAHFRATVRSICSAPIFIADVTNYDPAVMMLVGIRASVRRSINILCTSEADTDDLWRRIPFNIREVKIVSMHDARKRIDSLATVIQEGIAQSREQTNYLDLPAYEYLRQSAADLRNSALFLRSFSDKYKEERLEGIHQHLNAAFSNHYNQQILLESVLDDPSPRLAGQRLYQAIRHCELCVIDWSEWKANVFFELGARLATHPTIPISLLDERPTDAEESKCLLQKLFSPVICRNPNDEHSFSKIVADHKERKSTATNHAFEVAMTYFDSAQENYETQIDESLATQARQTVGGGDPLQNVEPTLLFSQNAVFRRQILRSSFEQLCAAWCYLDEREAPYLWTHSELLDFERLKRFIHYMDLGRRLKEALHHRQAARDQRLFTLIEDREKATSSLSGFAENLNRWSIIQQDLSRRLSTKSAQKNLNILSDLRKQLNGMAGVSTTIYRQALEQDIDFLERWLRTENAND